MIIKTLGQRARADGTILIVKLGNYDTDPKKVAIALESVQGSAVGVLSVNCELPRKLGEFVVASHHHDQADLDAYLKAGLFEDTGERVDFGYVKGAPVWRLSRPEDFDAFKEATAVGASQEPTAYAVNCSAHGLVYLTNEEYLAQMRRPDARWECPRCGMRAYFDDEVFDKWCETHEPAEDDL